MSIQYKVEMPDGTIEIISKKEKKGFCNKHKINTSHLSHTNPKHIGTSTYRKCGAHGLVGVYRILQEWDDAFAWEDQVDLPMDEDDLIEEKSVFDTINNNSSVLSETEVIGLLGTTEVEFTKEPFQTNNDEYLIKKYHKLTKQNQKLKDELRITRRENRLDDRIENVFESFYENIFKNIEKYQPSRQVNTKEALSSLVKVVVLSDLHFGEVVKLKTNNYNFQIAEERLDKLFEVVLEDCRLKNIHKVVIMTTGDLFNLDSHLDKMLTNEAPRAESLQKGFSIISKMIDKLLNNEMKVEICGVVGNESRVQGLEKMSTIDSLALDNFDFLLFVLLKARYSNSIKFLNNCDKLEDMVNINGKNFIILHGNNIKHMRLNEEVNKLKMKWFKNTGVMADYTNFGHLHEALVSHLYARSGSLVGGNGYSEIGLNIPDSFPSQNTMVVGKAIRVTSIRLD